MSILSGLLNQTITYWASPTKDGYGGFTFDTGVEIDGRWEDKQEIFMDASGEQLLSRAVVYLNQDVDIGGYLYNGASTGIAASNPQEVTGAIRVMMFNKVPDLNNTEYVRKIWLK
jgi:hypothetical protein